MHAGSLILNMRLHGSDDGRSRVCAAPPPCVLRASVDMVSMTSLLIG
jgi:hypothetical protein